MKKSETFKFSPDLWFANKSLRACSPAARGFWVDLMCLCLDSGGYLHINGQPVDDTALARITGEPIGTVRKLLKELGDAGVYSVDDRGLYSSRMRREAGFVEQAKVSGARGQVNKKAKSKTVRQIADEMPETHPNKEIVEKLAAVKVAPKIKFRKELEVKPEKSPIIPAQPKKRPLDWWKTDAGWMRKGNEQAISKRPDEHMDDFKGRVAAKFPPGPHLDVLPIWMKDQIISKATSDDDSMHKQFGR